MSASNDISKIDLSLPTDFALFGEKTNYGDWLEKRSRGKLPDPDPRKGMFRLANSVINKKQSKQFTLSAATLGRLANTDPITWAIRRTIKSYISQVGWDIVSDITDIEAELNRFETVALANLNPYQIEEDFTSVILDPKMIKDIQKNVKKILKDPTNQDKKGAIRWYFQSVLRRVEQDAESHRHEVKRIFESPNTSDVTFRVFQEKIIDDLLVYDAAVLIKNWSATKKLAELYTLPGQEIKRYINEDRTVPEPPEAAYVWEQMGINRAEFSADELIYMMANPQQNHYGMSPLEVSAYIITASLYADEYQIDFFKNSNVPPGVLSLGEEVSDDDRRVFQSMWENEVRGRGGQHRMLFLSGASDPKFIPMSTYNNKDMQLLEYLKWTMDVKCACYGVSPQDLGFTDKTRGLGGGGVAAVQERLSKSRGIQSILKLLEEYYNIEIVKKEYPYTDVKFEWNDEDLEDPEKSSQVDIADINAGVINRNERRHKLGLKPIDGGDAYVIQTTQGIIQVKDLEENPMDSESSPDEQAGIGNAEMQPGSNEPTDSSASPQQQPNQTDSDKPELNPAKPLPVAGQAPPGTQPGTPGNKPMTKPQKLIKDRIKVVVNRKKPIEKQHSMLENVVKSLQEQGINTELHIGFDKKE